MTTLYTDLLRIIQRINLEDKESIRQGLLDLAKEIEDKLKSLNTRVTTLGG